MTLCSTLAILFHRCHTKRRREPQKRPSSQILNRGSIHSVVRLTKSRISLVYNAFVTRFTLALDARSNRLRFSFAVKRSTPLSSARR
jgi:hypothetical protein